MSIQHNPQPIEQEINQGINQSINQSTINQLTQQLRTTFISEYAYKPDLFLTFDESRAYHFRMDLSDYYGQAEKEMSKATLTKVARFLNSVIDGIFGEASQVVFFEYVYEPKRLNQFIHSRQVLSDQYGYCAGDQEEALLRTMRYSLKHPSQLYKIVKALVHQDFPGLDATAAKMRNHLVLMNPEKELLIHIYDDRGCDIFCRNESDYKDIMALCKEQIDYYTQMMEKHQYQVIDSPYGLRFKR